MDYSASYKKFAEKYLGRSLRKQDGVSAAEISRAEKRLGVQLPEALRVYYRVAGNANELNTAHNQFYALSALEVEGDYLLFMDENQSVVSWGFRLADLKKKNPRVWQRNNSPRLNGTRRSNRSRRS